MHISIEREDGALITSANYKWGRDIGVRLEAGTQAGYIKTVIDLSDGTTLTSNEYKIVEVLESDVYVTAITLVPDMTAGTIGGNISYSNGTTQTINAVNVPTAPGVTSAIEALQSRMTAVENTNNTQNSQITALTNRVQAIEDTPGVGQFGAGKLGTIAGSAVDGRVAAEDDGTGSVNGWGALKDRVTAAEGQIVTAQGDIAGIDGQISTINSEISGIMTDISNIETKNSEQDQSIAANTSALAGKVDVAQGVENAGKALVVGDDGNVSLSLLESGRKSLYTSPIDNLFSITSHSVEILREFDIEYISVIDSRVASSRVTISKGVYNTLSAGYDYLYLGVTNNLFFQGESTGWRCCLIFNGSNLEIVQISYDNRNTVTGNKATQLTSDVLNPTNNNYYYRIYA